MSFDDFKSNADAIKRTLTVSQKKKAALLRTQMKALDMLLLDELASLTNQEKADAHALYRAIDASRYTLLHSLRTKRDS